MKKCTHCKETLPLQNFSMSGKYPKSRCKVCIAAIRRKKYETNDEVRSKAKADSKKWREDNPEFKKIYNKRYREDHLDELKEYQRSDIAKRSKKNWESNNRDRRNKYARDHRANDPHANIANRLRCRIRAALHNAVAEKRARSLDLLGCSVDNWKIHLEGLFTDGMSWENQGAWEIDHIRPVSSFDLTDEEEQRAAFHYTNTQPLWAEENRAKGASV